MQKLISSFNTFFVIKKSYANVNDDIVEYQPYSLLLNCSQFALKT